MEEQVQNPSPEANSSDSKAIGILSYLGLLWIIAYILYGNNKTEYNIFHLRQGLGLFIIGIINYIIGYLPFIGWISFFIWIVILIFMIMGVINAANGQQKELPIVGEFISENLKNFN